MIHGRRDRFGKLHLPSGRHQPVLRGHHHGHRYLDVADPLPGAEPPKGLGRLEHAAHVVATELVKSPAPTGGVDELFGHLLGEPFDGGQRSQPQPTDDEPEPGVLHPLVPAAPEVAARGAQHHAVDPLGVAAPDELRDRPAHRVPVRSAQTSTVSPMVERHDAKVPTERTEGGEPVEAGGGGQTVHEHERRRSSRPCHLTDEGRSPARQLDGRAGRHHPFAVGFPQPPRHDTVLPRRQQAEKVTRATWLVAAFDQSP